MGGKKNRDIIYAYTFPSKGLLGVRICSLCLYMDLLSHESNSEPRWSLDGFCVAHSLPISHAGVGMVCLVILGYLLFFSEKCFRPWDCTWQSGFLESGFFFSLYSRGWKHFHTKLDETSLSKAFVPTSNVSESPTVSQVKPARTGANPSGWWGFWANSSPNQWPG